MQALTDTYLALAVSQKKKKTKRKTIRKKSQAEENRKKDTYSGDRSLGRERPQIK